MVKWENVVKQNRKVLEKFAFGDLSGRQLYDAFVFTKAGGEVRRLLKTHGVTYSKRLARKALRRRVSV